MKVIFWFTPKSQSLFGFLVSLTFFPRKCTIHGNIVKHFDDGDVEQLVCHSQLALWQPMNFSTYKPSVNLCVSWMNSYFCGGADDLTDVGIMRCETLGKCFKGIARTKWKMYYIVWAFLLVAAADAFAVAAG